MKLIMSLIKPFKLEAVRDAPKIAVPGLAALWIAINAMMGIRVTAEHEVAGLDAAELGMEAYPEFGKGSQFI